MLLVVDSCDECGHDMILILHQKAFVCDHCGNVELIQDVVIESMLEKVAQFIRKNSGVIFIPKA